MKDVKRASRSEEGHLQERTENEPEGERDFTRSGLLSRRGPSLGWGDHSA